MYDGERLNDDMTPGDMNMDDNDTIEVVLHRAYHLWLLSTKALALCSVFADLLSAPLLVTPLQRLEAECPVRLVTPAALLKSRIVARPPLSSGPAASDSISLCIPVPFAPHSSLRPCLPQGLKALN